MTPESRAMRTPFSTAGMKVLGITPPFTLSTNSLPLPLPRGKGYEFVDKVKGGVIPNTFIPAVEKGVRMALDSGVIAGYPVHDIRVTVYDGKHHAVDSKEVAFVSAGRKAIID